MYADLIRPQIPLKMRGDAPEAVANGIKIAVIDFLRSGDEKSNEGVKRRRVALKSSVRESLTIVAGEFIGTALLLFLGCMGCISAVDPVSTTHHMSALSFGLVVMLLIMVFGHITGAHFNPAVTIASVVLGYVKIALVPVYFFAQFAGAIAGFSLLILLAPYDLMATEIPGGEHNKTYHKVGVCSTVPYEKTSPMQALLIEALITTVLILVCAAVWDKRNDDKTDSAALKFGFVIAVIGMVAGPFTGASMNTVRTLAPALFNNDWEGHWIYWVGPTIGGFFGSTLYKVLFSPPREAEENDDIVDENILKI